MTTVPDIEKAFHYIIDLIEGQGINYQISGGLAARVHGSERLLADIDIDVEPSALPRLAELTKEYVVRPLGRYQDAHWDLLLLTINVAGQEIDLCSPQALIFNHVAQAWKSYDSDLSQYEIKEVFGRKVRVETRDALLTYKRILGREVDIEDVRSVSRREIMSGD
jgi:hypothetical protein